MAYTRGLYTAVLKFSACQFTKLHVSRGPLLCGVFVAANGHHFTTLCLRPVLRHPDREFRSLARYAPILSTRKIYVSAHCRVTTPSPRTRTSTWHLCFVRSYTHIMTSSVRSPPGGAPPAPPASTALHFGREILDPFASPVDAYSHTNNFRSLAISNRADCP